MCFVLASLISSVSYAACRVGMTAEVVGRVIETKGDEPLDAGTRVKIISMFGSTYRGDLVPQFANGYRVEILSREDADVRRLYFQNGQPSPYAIVDGEVARYSPSSKVLSEVITLRNERGLDCE